MAAFTLLCNVIPKLFFTPNRGSRVLVVGVRVPTRLAKPWSCGLAQPLILVSLLFLKGLLARTQRESYWHIIDVAMGVFAFRLSHQVVGWGLAERLCSWAVPGLGARKYSAGCRKREGRERSVGQHACFRVGMGLLSCFLWKAAVFGEVPADMTWRCARVCG